MKNIRLLFCCVLLLGHFIGNSQDFTNKGKDFWITYPTHIDGQASAMGIYITSNVNATGTITVGTKTISFSLTANAVVRKFIGPTTGGDAPNTAVYLSTDDGVITGAAIHVVSDNPVAVYAHIIRTSRSGATLVLPSNVWGKEYIVPSYQNYGNSASYGAITVVAAEANTTIEVTPSVNSKNGAKTAGNKYTIVLPNPGDVYQLQFQGSGDISGTKVQSAPGIGGSCKKIAVFSSTSWSAFDCGTPSSGGDNLYQQLFPTGAWGKNFITAPFKNRQYDIVRVFVNDPSTVVTKTENGATITLTALSTKNFYEYKTANPTSIQADKPISVVHYITSTTCSNGCGTGSTAVGCLADPEMVILNPIEQTINNITVFSAHQTYVPPNQSAITNCFLNIIIKTNAKSSFKINGLSPVSQFVAIPGTVYSYLQEELTVNKTLANPVQNLVADSSFSAIAYGFGVVESYGYNAGTNVRDLTPTPIFQNPYARLSFAATCANTPFQFSVPLSYRPTSLRWDFGTTGNISPGTTLDFPAPQADSTPTIGGQAFYYYSPANGNGSKTFMYSRTGTDTIKLYASNPSPDGCSSNNAEYAIPVIISTVPAANFGVNAARCISDPISFRDSSTNLGTSTIVSGLWNWDDGKTDSLKNPSHIFQLPKTYNIRYRPISDFGCIGDTVIPFDISAAPIAGFVLNDSTCVGKTLTFVDSSSITTGSIVKWYWDYGDGSVDTLTTNASRTKTYSMVGAYTAKLTVENNTGCKSNAFSKTINIHPAPQPNFNLPVVCLPSGTADFIDSTVISDGSGNFTYAWDFGDGKGVATTANPVYHYLSVGPFDVKLTVTSKNGCVQTATKTLASVYAQAKADFTVNSENCLRDSTSFTDKSNGSGNTVAQWNWDLGDGSIDTAANPVHLYLSAGTKTVKLFVLTDKGCSSDTIIKTVVVNPLPTALFSLTSPLCEARAITFTDQSTANAGALKRWNWNFKDSTLKDTANGAPFTKVFTAWGSYDVRLMVETDKGCRSDTVVSTTRINPLPQVGFVLPEICVSDGAATFTDSSKIADGSQAQFVWKWTISPGNNFNAQPTFVDATAQNAKVLVSKADDYRTLLKVTSNKGCSDSLFQVLTVNGPTPKANFVVQTNNPFCSNDSIRIVNTSTVDFGYLTRLDIVWDLIGNPTKKTPDETPVDQRSYSTIYADFQSPATVNYSVKLTAFSGNSSTCQNSITKIVTLNRSPKVSFVKPRDICNDASPRLIIPQASTVSTVPGTPNYIGKGITNAVTGLFDPAIADTGTHSIKYLHVSDKGCRDSISQPITVWPSPIAKWSISSPDCEKNLVTFTDSSLANFSNIARRVWDFGDSTTQTFTNANAFTHVYASAKTYYASLKIITDSNCVSTLNIQSLKINYLPRVDFMLPSVCLPDGRAQFNNVSTIPDGSEALFSYLWNFNDPNDPSASAIKTPTHRYSALGPYNVKLVVTSKDGCVDSVTKSFTTIYPQPKADFTSIPSKVCMGDTIRFMDNSNGITSAANAWNWDLAGGITSVLQNPLKKFSDSGVFNISLYVFNGQGCVSDTVTKQVTVYPYPKLTLGPTLKVLDGGEVTIKPFYYYGTSLSFLWTPSLYLDSVNIATPKSTPLDDITYKLFLTGIGGCSVSDEIFIKVLKSPEVPNAFSPNGDGINDTWRIKYLESYPGASIEVFNRYGQRVFYSVGYDVEWDGNVNGKTLPVGTYYYIIDPKNGRKMVSGSVTIIK